MTAYTFTIRTRETGQFVGQAVLCAEARYVSIWWKHPPRVDRRFATPTQWLRVINELDAKLPAAPLEDESTIVKVLAGDHALRVVIQYLSAQPINEGDAPDRVAVALEQRLRMLQQV